MRRVRRSPQEARAAYDRMSAWYDLIAGMGEARYVEAGLRMLEPRSGETILEIGFGTGGALVALERSVGTGGRVLGVDISEGMARRAKEKIDAARLSRRPSLVCADGARLPLRDGWADGVFLSFTLELFDTPRLPEVLGACRRVLREAGRLCVVSLSREDEPGLPVRVYEWVHSRMPRYVDCRPIPVEEVLRSGGFRVDHLERYSMWGLPVDVALARPEVGDRET